jgi:hypothetical protein
MLHSDIHKDSSLDKKNLTNENKSLTIFFYNRKANHIMHSQNGNTTWSQQSKRLP